MRMYDIIRHKRDRVALSAEEIRYFVRGYTAGDIPDYQAAALLMAIFLNGMNDDETVALTQEMLHSGEVLDWSDIDKVKVDKHSTGGVGDKTSLILAPIAAAAGVAVPMISGRGLGHTGGTLDKLESIPGFRVQLSAEEFSKVLHECGLVLAGQTGEIAPADKKLYALRDVTATVESIPLITSSILSKKLAEGIDALVLDVKMGSGAFMKSMQDAQALARSLVSIGTRAGKQVVALITDMEQPLGTHVGNSLEVMESVEILRGEKKNDLAELSFELAAHMMVLGKVADSMEQARAKVDQLVADGSALRKFQQVVAAQGGDPLSLEDFSRLPNAKRQQVFAAPEKGYIQRIDAESIGLAAMELGAGRAKVDSEIDPAVGVVLHAKVGDHVEKGAPLATIYYNDPAKLEPARRRIESAYSIGESRPEPHPIVLQVIR